jgi:hypothetical protein
MGCDRWDLDWVAIVGVQVRVRSVVMGDRWGSEPMCDRWGSGLGAIGYTVNMDSPKYHAQKDP